MMILAAILIHASFAVATPSINLPINAQLPPVAIADQPYKFIFSTSTFTSTTDQLAYALGDCPSWLQLDSLTRTLHGTPDSNRIRPGDVRSFVADLVATDGTGSTSLPVTFVVTADPGPGLGTPVTAQLPALGSFSSPDALLLTPGDALSLTFSPTTFTNTNANTKYYAVCSNNTPLPSWIKFDPDSLTFSGVTPQATSSTELPQTFGIELAASEVTGFAQAITSFKMVIESHIFAFGNSIQIMNATVGSSVNLTGLQHDLTLDGQPIQNMDISQVVSDAPSWLSVFNSTLAISGMVPPDAIEQNFTVTATDRFGDIASTVILIQTAGRGSGPLFSTIPMLNATIGTNFSYSLKGFLASAKELNVTVNPITASAWLNFDSNLLEIHGDVPSKLKPQTVEVNVTAVEGSQSQSQIVGINVVCGSATCPTTNSHTDKPMPTTSIGVSSNAYGKTSKTWVAAAVILPLFALTSFFCLICCFRRRKRSLRLEPGSKSPRRFMISRPTFMEKDWGARYQESLTSDSSGSSKMLQTQGQKLTRSPRLLSLSNDARRIHGSSSSASWRTYIRTPESSRQKHLITLPELNFIPEERRTNRLPLSQLETSSFPTSTETSPTRRPSQRDRHAGHLSSGILPNRPIGGFGHGRSEPSQGGDSLLLNDGGIGHGGGGISTGPPGWGHVYDSWRNPSKRNWTSTQSSINSHDLVAEEGQDKSLTRKKFNSMILSFPRPSTSNTLDIFARSHVIHEASDDEASGIDVHKPLPRNSSNPKIGSSFRRNGNAKNTALEDFHKRRLKQASDNPLFSARLSSSRKPSIQGHLESPESRANENIILERKTPPKDLSSQSHSESFPPEPPANSSSPARSSRSMSVAHGQRSRINYNFATRILSPLRRSRSSYASTMSSSKFSDPVGIIPFFPHGASQRETDAEGNTRWRHLHHPNPLNTNRTEIGKITDVSDAELIYSLRAARQFDAANRLSYFVEHIGSGGADRPEIDTAVEVRSARGRILDHKSRLKSGYSEKKSMEGDIEDAGGSSAFV